MVVLSLLTSTAWACAVALRSLHCLSQTLQNKAQNKAAKTSTQTDRTLSVDRDILHSLIEFPCNPGCVCVVGGANGNGVNNGGHFQTLKREKRLSFVEYRYPCPLVEIPLTH